MNEERERLDILLINKGIFQSRERAQEHISKGNIYVDGKCITKSGKKVLVQSNIEFKGEKLPYVGRGGLKLEKAIELFNIDLNEKKCMDIGASTGGFTDCMLQKGAAKVYAIDVGTDQLHEDLRNNKKVISMEKTNIRFVTVEDLGELCDFASIDVSFISLTKVIPSVVNLLHDSGEIVALIKPQFECGKGNLNKKGVVKKQKVHIKVIENIINFINELEFSILNLTYSPVKGPNGNIEYLIHFTKQVEEGDNFYRNRIEEVINEAHEKLE